MENILNDLFIFEMANNHQGSVEHGIRIIKEMGKIARQCNIKAAVKLQYRNLDSFIHPDYKGNTDVKHIKRFESTKLTYEQFCELVDAIREEGLIPISTPFDETGVEWCVCQGLEIIKIASCSSMDWPLLNKAALTHKPLIVSTGGKTTSDIDKIYSFLIHRNVQFAFMHCVAEYPTPESHIQLDFIDKMKKRYYKIPVGYSGHEAPDNVLIPSLAAAKGVRLFERHVGVGTDKITLNPYTMNPKQTCSWVEAIQRSHSICNLQERGEKHISQGEMDSLRSLMRGCYAKKHMEINETLDKEKVFFAMPCLEDQMSSGDFYDGCVCTKEYKENDPIFERKKYTDVSIARSVIHEVKSMLYEAGIILNCDIEVELSHHYGIRQIRKFGAVIINVINREYCKKIIIVLPGQLHPRHMHKKKEETFQVLYGNMELELENEKKTLSAGNTQTIFRGQMHSFSSIHGAIFEEISTTHIKNDSYYEDTQNILQDPMERKTYIKNW